MIRRDIRCDKRDHEDSEYDPETEQREQTLAEKVNGVLRLSDE
jgi:hypothetical protein